MTEYELAIRIGRIEEHLEEARHLAERFPDLFGAAIQGVMKSGDRPAIHNPPREDYPAVPGWGGRPLIGSIDTPLYKILYGGDAAGFMDFRRLAASIAEPALVGMDAPPRDLAAIRATSPEILLATMAFCGRKVDLYTAPVLESQFEHHRWHGRCRLIVFRHGLFRSLAYSLRTTLAGLLVESNPPDRLPVGPAEGPSIGPTRPHPTTDPRAKETAKGPTMKHPSPQAIECYRLKFVKGEETTQAGIAHRIYGSRNKQSKVSRFSVSKRDRISSSAIPASHP